MKFLGKFEDHTRKYQQDVALLARPLSELSLDELKCVKEILIERIKVNDSFIGVPGELGEVNPEYRLPEKTIQGLYDGQAELEKKARDYPTDLKIIEGLISKMESHSKE